MVAVIDAGTNSVRLLVANLRNNSIDVQYKDLLTTRLGKGVDRSGRLEDQAIISTMEAIKGFRDRAFFLGADEIMVVATSAVRDAVNGKAFMQCVEKLGVETRILTGEEEAEIGFLGACMGIDRIEDKMLMLDIGGGSTELVLGAHNSIDNIVSLNIGAVRLTERFVRDNPIRTYELKRIAEFIKNELANCSFQGDWEKALMIGVGGTITSLAAIDQKMETYDRERIHGYELSEERIGIILAYMADMTLEERQMIPGLQPQRADIIVTGTIILKCIMEYFSQHTIYVSEWDNLEGAVYKRWILSH